MSETQAGYTAGETGDLLVGWGCDSTMAEQIMGWYLDINPIGRDQWRRVNDHFWAPMVNDWQPSLNMNHAFNVVDKLADDDWDFSLSREGKGTYKAYFCHALLNSDDPIIAEGEAETPMLAICRAALKAVEGKAERKVEYPERRYSTNIVDAMDVADKLIADGWDFRLIKHAKDRRWSVSFEPTTGYQYIDGWAEEPAEAICLAALKVTEFRETMAKG